MRSRAAAASAAAAAARTSATSAAFASAARRLSSAARALARRSQRVVSLAFGAAQRVDVSARRDGDAERGAFGIELALRRRQSRLAVAERFGGGERIVAAGVLAARRFEELAQHVLLREDGLHAVLHRRLEPLALAPQRRARLLLGAQLVLCGPHFGAQLRLDGGERGGAVELGERARRRRDRECR